MCDICTKWGNGDMSSQEAFQAIGQAMSPKTQKHLEDLSEKILAKEVPMPDTNEEADAAFWNSTHREDSDG